MNMENESLINSYCDWQINVAGRSNALVRSMRYSLKYLTTFMHDRPFKEISVDAIFELRMFLTKKHSMQTKKPISSSYVKRVMKHIADFLYWISYNEEYSHLAHMFENEKGLA